MILCPRHGRSGVAFVCSHIADQVGRGRLGGFQRLPVLGQLFCGHCFESLDLAAFVRDPRVAGKGFGELDDDALDACGDLVDRIGEAARPLCTECLAAAQVDQARNDGRPDPFPVYERTLTSHHSLALRELRAHLTDRFRFARSTDPIVRRDGEPGGEPAVFVRPGTYRHPMTVDVYYVVDPAEQHRIIELVAEFLAGRYLDQARVAFHEAEVWNVENDPVTGEPASAWRGAESLVREAFLHC